MQNHHFQRPNLGCFPASKRTQPSRSMHSDWLRGTSQMLSSLDIMQQYSNTGRKVGVGWSISLYPILFLVIPWKEKMHLVHSKPYCVVRKELHRSLYHRLLSPGTKSCQKQTQRQKKLERAQSESKLSNRRAAAEKYYLDRLWRRE